MRPTPGAAAAPETSRAEQLFLFGTGRSRLKHATVRYGDGGSRPLVPSGRLVDRVQSLETGQNAPEDNLMNG